MPGFLYEEAVSRCGLSLAASQRHFFLFLFFKTKPPLIINHTHKKNKKKNKKPFCLLHTSLLHSELHSCRATKIEGNGLMHELRAHQMTEKANYFTLDMLLDVMKPRSHICARCYKSILNLNTTALNPDNQVDQDLNVLFFFPATSVTFSQMSGHILCHTFPQI